jgi:ABC-2 type transport system ATP-binding protein
MAANGLRDRGPAIRVQSLEKSYKELHVLRGVTFEVAPGSVFALLGSNGAGRTTIVRILSTLLRSDAGTASVNGFDVTTEPLDVRESISLTGQFAAVDEILSGRENLVLVARLRHLDDPGEVARRSPRTVQPHRCGLAKGVHLFRRDAASPGHRYEPDRSAEGDLPR